MLEAFKNRYVGAQHVAAWLAMHRNDLLVGEALKNGLYDPWLILESATNGWL